IIGGEITDVKVPAGYCSSPFLRVWRVLELLFADMNITIESNPFYEDPDLRRLVVLNNTADAICRGKVSYSELLPDCTVEEFMNALWVRFGLVYDVNYSTGTVSLRLIRDILTQSGATDITGFTSDFELIKYVEKQYVKLSAGTSIEGAAPATERWEDFRRNLSLDNLHLGYNVADWKYHSQKEKWEGDVRDEYYPYDSYDPDMDYPEPEEPWDDLYDWVLGGDDRDDEREDRVEIQEDREDDRTRARKVEIMKSGYQTGEDEEKSEESFLAREFVTGNWYKLDSLNGRVRLGSSSFFSWDPQPDGLTPLELSSADECVPVGRVSNVGTFTGYTINALMPLYLVGSRHFHSFIKVKDSETEESDKENEDNSTPLSFMFAFTAGGKTVGRLSAEDENGEPIKPDDGTTHTLSLYWQFRDGLFSRFWKEYDEILRHGNREAEVGVRVRKVDLGSLDFIRVYTLRGARCLLDTANYSLPGKGTVSVDLKLKVIQTQGDYNINEEQAIPAFSSGTRHLEWILHKENFGDGLATPDWKVGIIQTLKNEMDYQEHGNAGESYYIAPESIVVTSVLRDSVTWRNDPELPPVRAGNSIRRKYKAKIFFDVHEIHETVVNGEERTELCEQPIYRLSDTVEYTVVLRPVWISD
ncbi:MAG: hypothetical protein K2L89_06030, partial [Muribaculaceae bacterium]|nr:hypothetical protein [Muribaculaceae bacterium]